MSSFFIYFYFFFIFHCSFANSLFFIPPPLTIMADDKPEKTMADLAEGDSVEDDDSDDQFEGLVSFC